ncbi:MAG: lipopolysaccharide heptosyltransferase I [Chlamydiia bacterium]|nr:lipopolysaccharide heptosyltransferase I [Chlamydiia bacterium]
MKRILLIKLTSLGDLIHALPALSDAAKAIPGITFDWVIDEHFQEVALWHPNVKRLYITNHRKWKTGWKEGSAAIKHLIGALRKESYDLVIDGQGNFKSALLSLCTKGPRAGFDRKSVREWIAHLAYQKTYAASKKLHAIDRLRQLFSSALHYPLPSSPPDFQIQREKFLRPQSVELPTEYFVFIPNAGWQTKLWPERHWQELIRRATEMGFYILIPWGNLVEYQRAERLATHPEVLVLPKLSLSEIGYILERAKACVSMDTGLSHLAAALNIPAITLYGSTDSGLIGANGGSQVHLQSTLSCSPCQKKTCRFNKEENLCLAQISPERVYRELLRQASLRYL